MRAGPQQDDDAGTRPGPPSGVTIVGASAAGLSTAEALRRRGYQGRLRLLDAEDRLPYDRPPLSKQVLSGAWEPSRARLRGPDQLAALNAELLLGERAVSLDLRNRSVTTDTGRSLEDDVLVLATGLAPVVLPGQDGLAGAHVLRGLDHALALRRDLVTAARVVVVGEGVLGAEIAATARGLGLDVTLVGLGHTLLADQLGGTVGGVLTDLHTERGVRLRLGTAVESVVGDGGRVSGVRLTGGEVLSADVVVAAVGSRPATAWLEGSGLPLGDGVETDARCRAAPGIYAVGDAASWFHEGLGRRLRLENRTNAVEQAQAVAAAILGADRPFTPVPYFWTDQYDARIQAHGMPSPGAQVSIAEGDPADRRFVAVYTEGGRVTGVLGWNMPKQARLLRQEHLAPPDARRPPQPSVR
ncbi:NAD(P)/FAD-dependent oxidoreductase [Nocardiopsis sp. NRRL B-16309]|uniref:NAD(P)/FAD-dependent oxidoreductase n=1 Tax=Nocardiopsis sp. NRRL B-16309 TaxID=1519494 RepID=UPI0006AE03F0|nr:FAD-dependent oxidoreductase [Nocardiopsis sp. NRRL B-16309]KOX14231.1 pyridine nucleotide-disulfide oxidoreductase [Nocardiopsis sp. NRRL B-16309]